MEFIIIMFCPLLCLFMLFKVKKCGLFSLITVLATLAVIAIEVVAAFTSSDFQMLQSLQETLSLSFTTTELHGK